MALDTAISQYEEYDKILQTKVEEYWIPYMRKHTSKRDENSGIETS